jgi:hypothetical protein
MHRGSGRLPLPLSRGVETVCEVCQNRGCLTQDMMVELSMEKFKDRSFVEGAFFEARQSLLAMIKMAESIGLRWTKHINFEHAIRAFAAFGPLMAREDEVTREEVRAASEKLGSCPAAMVNADALWENIVDVLHRAAVEGEPERRVTFLRQYAASVISFDPDSLSKLTEEDVDRLKVVAASLGKMPTAPTSTP